MPICLKLNYTLPDSNEAKRVLTHLIEKVNQENKINNKVKLLDRHANILKNLVDKFNTSTMPLDGFKKSILNLFDDITNVDGADYEERRNVIRQQIAELVQAV